MKEDSIELDFVQFWKLNAALFPILARVARRVMAASACSSDVERLFSRSGIIFSPLRTNLNPSTLHKLTTLHYFYKLEETVDESNLGRHKESERRSDKFAKLAISRSAIACDGGIEYYDSDSSDD